MPLCKMCGKEVTRFIKSTNQWWTWCSNKCMGSDPEILKKKQETNVKKFGSHPMQSAEYKEKQKKTILEKYGVDNPAKSLIIKEKMKATFIERYGVDNPSKHKDVIEKLKISALDRFAENKEEILFKRRNTNLKKFGVETNKHLHISADSRNKMKDLQWLLHQHQTLKKSCDQIAAELGVSPTPILTFLSNNGIEVLRHNRSQCEDNIVDFIKTIYSGPVMVNSRNVIPPRELDIWLPDQNIAIEVNGVFWHSESKGKDRNYHLSKTKTCEDNGIHLLQIYDFDWETKTDIVKSKIRYLLGQTSRIFGKKCTVAEVSNKEAAEFLKNNHLQGTCPSKVRLGLYYNSSLYAIATFGKARYNKSIEWELLRFSNRVGFTVVGGISKLFQHFIKHYSPTSIISYADRRWSAYTKNVYKSIGFTFAGSSPPNYKYFSKNDASNLLSRTQFQKHLLSAKLPVYNEILSEYENMINNGYDRIWDCGNLIYKWNLNETR